MNYHKSTDYKFSAVKYYLNNKEPSLSKTCEIFECSKYSLARWVRRFIETNSVENKPRIEGSYKIKQKHVGTVVTVPRS